MKPNKQQTSSHSKTKRSSASSSFKNTQTRKKKSKKENKKKRDKHYLQNVKNKAASKKMTEQRKFDKKEAELALKQYVIDAKKAIKEQEKLDHLKEQEFKEKAHAKYVAGQRLAAERKRKLHAQREIEARLLKDAKKEEAKQNKIKRKQHELYLKRKYFESEKRLKVEDEKFVQSYELIYKHDLENAKKEAARISSLQNINNQRMHELNIENDSYLAKKELLAKQEERQARLDAIEREKESKALSKQAQIIALAERKKQEEIEHQKAIKEKEDAKKKKQALKASKNAIKKEKKAQLKYQKADQRNELNAAKRLKK